MDTGQPPEPGLPQGPCGAHLSRDLKEDTEGGGTRSGGCTLWATIQSSLSPAHCTDGDAEPPRGSGHSQDASATPRPVEDVLSVFSVILRTHRLLGWVVGQTAQK